MQTNTRSSRSSARSFSRRPAQKQGESSVRRPVMAVGSFRYEGKVPRFGAAPQSFGSRGGRFGSRGGSRGGKRGPKADYIDETRFINKSPEITEEAAYVPTHTFADFNIHESLAKNLARKGFVHPSPIQDQAIPVALERKDLIGIAATGTGKTAAFLIPIINRFVDDRMHQALVLAPTRELAQQIEDEFRAFTFGMRLFSVSVVGGLPINKQIKEIDMGVHIVIGTPGRVKDLIERGKLDITNFNTVVLDEADRMLDMGFIDDMREILGKMPADKHGMFFSATFSSDIKRLCSDFLREPVTISLKTRDTSASVDQDIVRVTSANKIEKLHEILARPEVTKAIIFRETKRHTDELARELRSRGFKVQALHGDMRVRERNRAVESLKKGMIQALIATDVAARGIDIADVSHVINYDTPSTYDTYIHRIGRTGRGSKKGVALTFVR